MSAFLARLEAVWSDYAGGRSARGVSLGAALVADHPGEGQGWFAYACCLERSGAWREADRAFARAARARENPQPTPYRISAARFAGLVEHASNALPDALRGALSEVTLIVEDYALPELIADVEEPELLGLFTGPERSERHDAAMLMTPVIYLWRRAHEHHCHDVRSLRHEVGTTLVHELGHYLSYDEDDLKRMGLD